MKRKWCRSSLRSIGEAGIIGAVGFGIEHARLLAVARDALALQIGDDAPTSARSGRPGP